VYKLKNDNERLSFADLRITIAEHLKTALGIEEFEITFARYEEELNTWRVNIEFKEEEFDRTALFNIDAKSGAVLEFKKGYVWRF